MYNWKVASFTSDGKSSKREWRKACKESTPIDQLSPYCHCQRHMLVQWLKKASRTESRQFKNSLSWAETILSGSSLVALIFKKKPEKFLLHLVAALLIWDHLLNSPSPRASEQFSPHLVLSAFTERNYGKYNRLLLADCLLLYVVPLSCPTLCLCQVTSLMRSFAPRTWGDYVLR